MAPLHALLSQHVDVIVCSCKLGIKKPESAIYEYALDQMGCTAEQAFMIGDSLKNDYLKPLELGIKSVFLDRDRKSHIDILVINNLSELLQQIYSYSDKN